MRSFLLTFFLISISGCATTKVIQTASTFDANKTKALLLPGKNKLTGNAFIRQNGGGIITCAGTAVDLIPKTDYSSERIRLLYGQQESIYLDVSDSYFLAAVKFSPDPPEYRALKRTVVCDSRGDFSFENVADGDFYIGSTILWKAGSSTQGGVLLKTVHLKAAETRAVILTPGN